MMSERMKQSGRALVVILLMTALCACAPKSRKAVGIMDTPEHHYNQGITFLDRKAFNDAGKEFALALELDEAYGPALAGQGLLTVIQGDDDGLKMIFKGERKADGAWEKVQAVAAEIRAYIVMKKGGRSSETLMIRNAKAAFAKGMLVNKDASILYFYMGEAYLQGLDFGPAEAMFAQSKALQGGFEERAYERWKFVQKANLAAPESMIGKKIALVEKLRRADMAALLVEELNVERFYNRTQEPETVSVEAPKGIMMQGEDLYTKKDVTDIADNPLRSDIDKVLALGVPGMQAYPDHTFRPGVPVSRVEAAQLFQDIIVRATGKQDLATEYIGDTSRMPDVPSDHWGYNAVRLCTTRGIMHTDIRNNSFYPQEVISGVDALLSIKEIKRALTVF
ncbi:MAG: S-layer homology domain-containing protein [Desulfoplanes sp.]